MIPTAEQQRAQGAKCGCRSSDDYCPCQNVVQGRWFAEQRLAWARECVEIFGFLNRAHLMRKFGISEQQASHDLGEAQGRWPQWFVYNKSAKRYEPNP